MSGVFGGLVSILRLVGWVIVALLVGPKRAGKAEGFETILGGAVLGSAIAYLLQASGLHVFYSGSGFGSSEPLEIGFVTFIGGFLGLASAFILYGLKRLLSDKD